jgi:hypothetical protein
VSYFLNGEMFAAQLRFQTLPPGTSAFGIAFGSGDLSKSFVARFDGQYATIPFSQSEQAERQMRVPVLVWESKGKDK